MRWRQIFFPQITVFTVVIAASLLGCGGQELASTWRDREVIVDGLDEEWEGAMTYLTDENVAIGLLNDEEYLYLCVATVDSRVVQQVVGTGLTVWFDAEGGNKKAFGINFSLGMNLSPEGGDMETRPMPGFGEGGPDPERIREMLESSASEMVMLGPGEKDRRLMPVAGSQKVKVKLGYAGGKLVYELRVPLIQDMESPVAIGLKDRRHIGVGFETAEIDREDMRERMKNRMSAGRPPMEGSTRDGGMRGGGGIPGGRGPGGEMPARLELWKKVSLASPDSGTSI